MMIQMKKCGKKYLMNVILIKMEWYFIYLYKQINLNEFINLLENKISKNNIFK